jgi:2-polyprenyl-3-methyl-5-hydroxy-6-metoxy-1,4-benzoquinol methylase
MLVSRKKVAKLALRLAQWCEPDTVDYHEVGLTDACRAGWFRIETRELLDGFSIAPSDTVIDVGCGDGGMGAFAAKFAALLIAVDNDPKKIAAVEQRLLAAGVKNYRTIVSDGNPLPIEAATGDKIVCTEVLEHVDDPVQFMDELVRIGKPGALYLLSVPDALSEQVLKRVSPAVCFEKPNHVRIIGREEFAQIATQAGLQIQKHVFYSFYWAVWHVLVWRCNIAYERGRHPALDHWARA